MAVIEWSLTSNAQWVLQMCQQIVDTNVVLTRKLFQLPSKGMSCSLWEFKLIGISAKLQCTTNRIKLVYSLHLKSTVFFIGLHHISISIQGLYNISR